MKSVIETQLKVGDRIKIRGSCGVYQVIGQDDNGNPIVYYQRRDGVLLNKNRRTLKFNIKIEKL